MAGKKYIEMPTDDGGVITHECTDCGWLDDTHTPDCYEAQIAALNQQLAAVEARNRTLSAEVEEIKEKYRKMHDTLNREQLCSWMFVDAIDRRYGEIKQGKNGEYSWEPRQAGVMDADDLLALACFMKRKEGKPLPTERRAKIEALEDVLADGDRKMGETGVMAGAHWNAIKRQLAKLKSEGSE